MAEATVTAFELDGPQGTKSFWTVVNAAEALPGIVTPLNWSWYYEPSETGQIDIFRTFGVVSAQDSPVSPNPDDRFNAVFYGRYVINVDTWRRFADRTPGMSGEALERQFFGSVRPGLRPGNTRKRFAAIAIKLPRAILGLHRKLKAIRADLDGWSQHRLAALGTADMAAATRILHDAHGRFGKAQATHLACSMVAQMVYQQLMQLVAAAGLGGIENQLTTGYGVEEAGLQEDLWSLAHGEGVTREEILKHHGFTGPGELARPSWRSDPSILDGLIAKYRDLPSDKSPLFVAQRQKAEREAAEAKLREATPRGKRLSLKLALWGARTYMPLRETGRAALLVALDVGRAAATRIGGLLVAAGRLDRVEDIFYLNMAEIDAVAVGGDADLRVLAAERRERERYYDSISLPRAWSGTPEREIDKGLADAGGDASVSGISVTNMSVTGIARVVMTPADSDDFEPGEILVCPLTDPSWASLFVIAAGVVIDVGGPLSHGAIVAREMGLPCVINTIHGTCRIETGSTIRIDGATGAVSVVAPAPAA